MLPASPKAAPWVGALAEAAADHHYPVPLLFREVRAARTLLAGLLSPGADEPRKHSRSVC
ncbi:MAG: hypothetical protein ACJ736_36505 [Streptomyces sp.]